MEIKERRTTLDFASCIKNVLDVHYPDAEKVVIVLDNLNTHKIGSLNEAFPPEEARRIAEKLEIHYTPKHGSWLNMAEIEISVLAKQCLKKYIPTMEQWRKKQQHGWSMEINQGEQSTGSLLLKMHGLNSRNYTHKVIRN